MSEPAQDLRSYNYCALPLADYACRPDQSRGRIYPEPESRYRTCFQRDRDRIIHSAAFRRLKHKTQVFVYHEGDHYRTRLTHTLEVAQIARTLARALLVNEDLAEAVALAHDLGHTPFAHVGEDMLQECMADVGGYNHNDQSLRVLVQLEHKYPDWRGLNLTWETLEGVAKHNGPVADKATETVQALQAQVDLELDGYASVEAQTAALADDIAYNNHDVEDGLTAGLFKIRDVENVKLLANARKFYLNRYPDMDDSLLRSGIVRYVIGAMVEDVIDETQRRLNALQPRSVADVRGAGKAMVAFSPDMHGQVEELRAFLWEKMYRHEHVVEMREKVSKIISDLYGLYMDKPNTLPLDWQAQLPKDRENRRASARVVADYIAGMTDRFAIREHERLFDVQWDMH
jgi:dGTPase